MSPAKKSRPLLKAFIFLMIALVLFSTIAIIAVYTNGTPAQNGLVVNTGTVVQPIDEPVIIIPGSTSGATNTGSASGSDIQLSLTGA